MLRGQKFHLSARNYEWNLERTSNSSQSTHPTGRVLWEELPEGSHITYYSLLFFIAITFKGQVHVFTGQMNIVSHLSCRTNAILKYFVPWCFKSTLRTITMEGLALTYICIAWNSYVFFFGGGGWSRGVMLLLFLRRRKNSAYDWHKSDYLISIWKIKSLTSSIFLTFWEFLSDIEAAMQALICWK